MDPTNREAAWTLARAALDETKRSGTFSKEGPAAIEAVSSLLQREVSPDLYITLGDLVAASGRHADALVHYHAAQSLEFTHEAQRKIEHVEQRLHGDHDSEDGDSDAMML